MESLQVKTTSSINWSLLRTKLLKLTSQKSPPPALANIIKILSQCSISYQHNPQNIVKLVHQLFKQILEKTNQSINIGNLYKGEKVDEEIRKFLGFQHHREIGNEIGKGNGNRVDMEHVIGEYREIVSEYFHQIVHGATIKILAMITVIFYKFVCLEILNMKIFNYFLLVLILSYESISSHQDIKIIKSCLLNLNQKKIIYACLPINNNPNIRKKGNKQLPLNHHLYIQSNLTCMSFTIICTILFCSHIHRHTKYIQQNKSQQKQLILKIISCPLQLLSIVLSFRYQFSQEYVYACDRNSNSLSQCIVDSFFLRSLLSICLDYKLQAKDKKNAQFIVQTLVSFNLNIQTVKNIIKRLQIYDRENGQQQWKNVFTLLKTGLPLQYIVKLQPQQLQMQTNEQLKQLSPKKSTQLQFFKLSQKSFSKSQNQQLSFILKARSTIQINIQNEFNGFHIQFKSYRLYGQYLIMKMINQQQQIWVLLRHIQQFQFQIAVINVDANNSTMQKLDLEWNPFDKHQIECTVQSNKIIFHFSTVREQQNSKQIISLANSQGILKVNNIKPKNIRMGSNQNYNLAYFSQISNFSIRFRGRSINNFIYYYKDKIEEVSKNVSLLNKIPLVSILKKLGDIDLFFLIASHLIRKVEGQQILKNMLVEVIDFLQCLAAAKNFQGVPLTQQMKQHRFYNVRCLVWLASKYKRDFGSIFQIFRLLSLRGRQNPLQYLQILSNVGLWKQFSQKMHLKMILKIKEICENADQEHSSAIVTIMRKITLDYLVFYKNSQLLSQNLQNDYLIKSSQILKLIYQIVIRQKLLLIVNFTEFIFKILYLLLDRTKNTDYVDTSIGFQLSLLAYRLIFTAKQTMLQKKQKNKISINSNKKPSIKYSKSGLASSKSMNVNMQTYMTKDEQSLILKLQQAIAWLNQITYMIQNQIQYDDQIKYYDWQWNDNQKHSSSSILSTTRKGMISLQNLKSTNQAQIIKLCELSNINLLSFNRHIFNLLNHYYLSDKQWQYLWDANLFEEKLSNQIIIDFLKFGYFETIKWDDQKVQRIISKSFDLFQNGVYVQLPQCLLQKIVIKDFNRIFNKLYSLYLQASHDKNSFQKQKCAIKTMYLITFIPDFVYTNTQIIRQEMNKQQRNIRTVQLIQKHLVIKQLVKESLKAINNSKVGQESRELYSTINVFDETKQGKINESKQINHDLNSQTQESLQIDSKSSKSKNRKGSQDIKMFSLNFQNVQFQQSFFQAIESSYQNITFQKLKQSLEHLRNLSLCPNEIQKFYQLDNKKQESKQQIKAHSLNFGLNLDEIIKALDQQTKISKEDRLKKLQNHVFFIKTHIYAFSKMIAREYIFADSKNIIVQQPKLKQKRKNSHNRKNVQVKFKSQAESLLQNFLRDRRKNVYKMENVWLNVQRNNKDFWDIFFKSQRKNQSVDIVCNGLKLKGLIKVDSEKRQIQLPKNMTTLSNKFSISGDSDRQLNIQQPEQCVIFQSEQYQPQQAQQEIQNNKNTLTDKSQLMKRKMINQFTVLYVTTTTVYQGNLTCETNQIKFVQDGVPNQDFYEIYGINENQRRTTFQIQKKKQQFIIFLNDKSTIIPKKYLYSDTAVQVYSQKQSYFFTFKKSIHRQKFLKRYQSLKGTIQNLSQLLENVQKQTQRWCNGDISNFIYLMHLNDLSGRSFNDMSQYYIFPWILTNYESQKFNKKFIKNEKNYRDLSKPVGALNPKRLDQLKTRYQQSAKYQKTQCYLYGSFCSNPAIVCNYLVRLQPFSMHHFLLQSKQFDIADRIFYSIGNQFFGSYTNIGDYKQLIPQFYSCPQFLRNRNKYKFGQKQNKQIVNNVELPKWAYYQFKKKQIKSQNFTPEQQFIFRMRKCLQTQYVTRNLNYWIDLIFGVYNKKQRAMQKNNLYIPNIYKNQIGKRQNKPISEMQIVFFKQFGQMPKDVFDRDHKQYKNTRAYYKLGNSQSVRVTQFTNQHSSQSLTKFYTDQHYFIKWNSSGLDIIDIKNKTGIIDRQQNTLTFVPLKNQEIQQVKIITAEGATGEDKKLDLMIYLKNGRLCVREMATSIFRKKLQVKQEKKTFFQYDTKFRLMQIYHQQKLIILVGPMSIKIYSFVLQANSIQKSGPQGLSMSRFQMLTATDQNFKIIINKKIELKLNLKFEFTQHKSRVEHIGVCDSYGLLISIDSNRKVFILKLNSKQIEVIQYFRLKKLTNCQNIIKMEVHQMGYIYILTSLNIIHVYNLMGDYIAMFNGQTLNLINKKMQTKSDSLNIHKKQGQKTDVLHLPQKRQRKHSQDITMQQRTQSCQIQDSDPQLQSTIIVAQQNKQKTTKLNDNILFDQFNRNQQINCFKIWNHQSGELVIGTSLGNVYRFDLYMLDDSEKVKFLKQKTKNNKQSGKQKNSKILMQNQKTQAQIQFISVNRIGRHWQCWVSSSQQLYKIESDDYKNADKRNQQYKKKYVLE